MLFCDGLSERRLGEMQVGWGLNQAISPRVWPRLIPRWSHFRNEVRFAPKIKRDRVGNGGRSGQLATNPPGSWKKAKHRQCFKNLIQPPPIHFLPDYSSVKGSRSYIRFGNNKNRIISDDDCKDDPDRTEGWVASVKPSQYFLTVTWPLFAY